MSLFSFFSSIPGPIIWLLLVAVFFVIVAFAFTALTGGRPARPEYEYRKKEYLMTEPERKCFYALVEAVGNKYWVFPQVHLAAFLDHKIVGQNWYGAFRHIDEKSVDFVLCDKQNLSLKLAIELDDRSHERPDRQERDREVERILKEAKMPLLRLRHEDLNPSDLSQKISILIV
jgi:hypothetical protein